MPVTKPDGTRGQSSQQPEKVYLWYIPPYCRFQKRYISGIFLHTAGFRKGISLVYSSIVQVSEKVYLWYIPPYCRFQKRYISGIFLHSAGFRKGISLVYSSIVQVSEKVYLWYIPPYCRFQKRYISGIFLHSAGFLCFGFFTGVFQQRLLFFKPLDTWAWRRWGEEGGDGGGGGLFCNERNHRSSCLQKIH